MSEQWQLPLALIGLVVATIVLAGLARRHQQMQAERQARARRLAAGASAIRDGLSATEGTGVPVEAIAMLRREVLERYQRIVKLDRRFPELNRLLLEAGARIKSQSGVAAAVPTLTDEGRVARVVKAVDELVETTEQGVLVQAVSGAERQALGISLREHRAELLARYYMARARKLWSVAPHKGRAQINSLTQLLRDRGPATERVKALLAEAEELRAVLESQPEKAEEADTTPAEGAGSSVSAEGR